MFIVYKFLGSILLPPGIIILFLFLLSAAVIKFKNKRIAPTLLLLAGIAIYFISTAPGSSLITGTLERKYRNSLPGSKDPTAFVVLAGGSGYDRSGVPISPSPYALERIYSAVTAADSTKDVLVFSGGNVYGYDQRTEAEIMYDCAIKMGWKGETKVETSSRTTGENMSFSRKMLPASKFKDVVIVTNAFHMPRAMLRARSEFAGRNIFPLSSAAVTNPRLRGISDLFPEAGWFHVSCMGIKEWLGILFYEAFVPPL